MERRIVFEKALTEPMMNGQGFLDAIPANEQSNSEKYASG